MAVITSSGIAANSRFRRVGVGFNHNAAYTVLFRFRIAAGAAPAYDTYYGVSGSSNSNGGTTLGSFYDLITASSSGALKLKVGTGTEVQTTFTPVADEWISLAMIRTDTTHIKLRMAHGTGTPVNSNNLATDVSAREATYMEVFFSETSNGCSANNGVTNYKAWTRALSDAEVDAEMLTTTVIDSNNLTGTTPFSNEQELAANLVSTLGGDWTTATDITYGANDPSVNYSGAAGKPLFYLAQL